MSKSNKQAPADFVTAFSVNPANFFFAGKKLNAEMFNDMMKFQMESLDFLRKRFDQDMSLATQLGEADEFGEMITCYLDFIRQAQIDYSNEIARLFRMNAGMASESAKKAERQAEAVLENFAVATAA